MKKATLLLCAALALTGCAKARASHDAVKWQLPQALPGAYEHLPPIPTAEPTDARTSLPIEISALSRNGSRIRIVWDAPGATRAVVSFSSDGRTFETMISTSDAAASFSAPAAHGIIRVAVFGPGRHGTAYARI